MKKGFTLVELLAVIVILGIIAVITTPVIRGIIDSARKDAFEDSVYGLIHAVELDKAERGFGVFQVYTIDSNAPEPIDPFIQVQGKVTGQGRIVLNEDGDIDVLIQFEDWCAYKPIETKEVVLYESPCIQNAETTNANRPFLHDDMIPVRYSGTNIVRADTRNPASAPWYNYGNKLWANAVIVSNPENYPEPGDVINPSDIIMELVWIPRFKYVVPSGSGYRSLDIEFIQGAPYVGSPLLSSGYRVHPAFTFGNKDLRGFWASKYQLTGSLSNLTVRNNQSPLTNQPLNVMFNAVNSLNQPGNHLGLSTGLFNVRLQSNVEWSAVAYLSQSEYGIDGAITRNTSATTGCTSTNCSTTGNITGVYDTVGPVKDFVMTSFNDRTGGSGLMYFPDERYYDKYLSDDINSACNGRPCLGHALSETSGFYSGTNNFITGARPFLTRGGNSSSGVTLSYDNSTGEGVADEGFKLTISRR